MNLLKIILNVVGVSFLTALSLSCVNETLIVPENDIRVVMAEIQSGRTPFEAEQIAHKAYSDFFGDVESPDLKFQFH